MVDVIGRAKVIVEGVVDTASVRKSGGTIGDTLKKGALVGGAAFLGLAAAGTKAFLSFKEGEASTRKLNNVLGNMGKSGAAPALDKLASQLQRTTGVSDDTIRSGQTLLATFSEVANSAGESGGAFERATKAAVDMAAAGFGSVESASVQLGKALQDPIKGVTALNRSGVTFTATQKEQIKNFVETGDVAAAQNLILKEVEKQVSGTAEANATGAAKMSQAFGEVEESIGHLISEATDGRLDSIPDLIFDIADSINEFAESDDWQSIVDSIGTIVDAFNAAHDLIVGDLDVEAPGVGTVLRPDIETINSEWNTAGHQAGVSFWQGVNDEGDVGSASFKDRLFHTMTREDIGSVLVDAFNATWPGFDAWFVNATEDFRNGFWKWWDDVETVFGDGWEAVKIGAQDFVGDLTDTITKAPSKIADSAARNWKSAGKKLINNFIDGIASGGFASKLANDLTGSLRTKINDGLGLPKSITLGGKFGVPEFSVEIPGLATGARNFVGGLAMVGETGPELVSLPAGSNVYTAQETRRMTANTGGDTINNYWQFFGPESLSQARQQEDWSRSYGTRFGSATRAVTA